MSEYLGPVCTKSAASVASETAPIQAQGAQFGYSKQATSNNEWCVAQPTGLS